MQMIASGETFLKQCIVMNMHDLEANNAVYKIPISRNTKAKWVRQGAHFYLIYNRHGCSDNKGHIDWLSDLPMPVAVIT